MARGELQVEVDGKMITIARLENIVFTPGKPGDGSAVSIVDAALQQADSVEAHLAESQRRTRVVATVLGMDPDKTSWKMAEAELTRIQRPPSDVAADLHSAREVQVEIADSRRRIQERAEGLEEALADEEAVSLERQARAEEIWRCHKRLLDAAAALDGALQTAQQQVAFSGELQVAQAAVRTILDEPTSQVRSKLLTAFELEQVSELLSMAGDVFSSHGCNDRVVPDTPEARRFIRDYRVWNCEPDDEVDELPQFAHDGSGIYTNGDDADMNYLSRRAAAAAAVLRGEQPKQETD